jgi:hypothetical protein
MDGRMWVEQMMRMCVSRSSEFERKADWDKELQSHTLWTLL